MKSRALSTFVCPSVRQTVGEPALTFKPSRNTQKRRAYMERRVLFAAYLGVAFAIAVVYMYGQSEKKEKEKEKERERKSEGWGRREKFVRCVSEVKKRGKAVKGVK